ncbi:ATP-binding protein [Cereibacter azotoformans]|uniref:histidine kinase n=1 Tax=Cereibacter azotoformans TaxID=43057 RepID=A0A2T5KCW2_9RHOB|nr:ATP-binding protein [Cereibacter azotoformans]AXQ93473.1 HAMP domain-containing protein [Cereibacter sphaeroides]MBO4168764.1 HAMP domain-containing protein [Cereibacter azotoformans]PTR20244.1 two-component system osmolarity sensor histidine kinase EnvZ [Cereibacter azotoformans]UIJ31809.1 ATP-binding protein [Cereibacter azotoformans]
MFAPLKSVVPRSLYGRAALILIVPIVTIQLVISISFIQRHYEGVTRQMARGLMIELRHLIDVVNRAPSPAEAEARAAAVAQALEFRVALPAEWGEVRDRRDFWDLSGRQLIPALHGGLPELAAVDLVNTDNEVRLLFETAAGPLSVAVERRRVSASNPHQLLVLMIVTSILMTVIAYLFLSNQLRPIKRLADAAEAFGKGQHIAYRPRGALEVRAAGQAFLEMRARIERQIEQRTLMLSGVSHDLRTPLTRLRLGLSMLSDPEEAEELLRDVADMERLVDEFLSFVRGDALEEAEQVDPLALVARVVENAQRAGQKVTLVRADGEGTMVLRPAAVGRALENLVGNAVRYGSRAEVSVALGERALRITVEDDGPGIPRDRRDEALRPFTRLDQARNQNRGGGVGLGLTIAMDIARNHGGTLRLGESPTLGGLRAELTLAR